MPLTGTHSTIAAQRPVPWRPLVVLALGLAAAVIVGMFISGSSPDRADGTLTSQSVNQARFVEANTTGLPVMAGVVGSPVTGGQSVERFVEANTTGLPAMGATGEVADDFLYWNIGSLEFQR